MALRSALRYALAGATGAAEGYGAKQQRLQQEEQRRLAQERQARQDQLDMEEKMAGLLSSGFMPEEEAVSRQQAARSAIGSAIGSALASAEGRVLAPPSEDGLRLAAEGAAGYNTGRKASFGGKTFVLPETAAERTERTKRTEKQMELRQTEAERSRLYTLAEEARKGGRSSSAAARLAVESPQAYNQMFPDPSSGFASLMFRQQQAQQKQEDERRQGMAFLSANRGNQQIMEAYAAALAAYPNLSPDEAAGIIGYDLMMQAAKGANINRTVASTDLSKARAESIRNPRNRPPGMRAPAAGGTATPPGAAPRAPGAAPGPVRTPAKPAANAPVVDPLDAAFDRFNQQR